jgi:uncharacterized membrane protein
VSLLGLVLLAVVGLILGLLAPRSRVEQESRFPKKWHGAFVVLLGLAIAFLGGSGLLGGMKHREQDLDTAVLCGLGIALLGFIVLVWVSIRSRRNR